jgi:hypothetical protein
MTVAQSMEALRNMPSEAVALLEGVLASRVAGVNLEKSVMAVVSDEVILFADAEE